MFNVRLSNIGSILTSKKTSHFRYYVTRITRESILQFSNHNEMQEFKNFLMQLNLAPSYLHIHVSSISSTILLLLFIEMETQICY